MGKREGRKETKQTLTSVSDDVNGEEGTAKLAGFFTCYLLTSLCPRFKGHTYIGFTVNPRRRIRQHNGEIGSGAWRTKKKRPWEMVLIIYGFPTNVSALQFEWAWQHPSESLAVRKAATSFKSLSGLPNKIKLAYTMLSLPPWQSLNLTVNLFSTKYQMHTSGCLGLPDQMRMRVGSMDELPCYSLIDNEWDVDNNFCELSPEENVTQETDHNTDNNVDTVVQSSGSISGDDQAPAFMFGDSPARKSMAGSVRKPQLETGLDDEERVSTESRDVATSIHQVEIIDVFTPSPGGAVNSGSKKKRRWSTVGPKIIDLTFSPLFVG